MKIFIFVLTILLTTATLSACSAVQSIDEANGHGNNIYNIKSEPTQTECADDEPLDELSILIMRYLTQEPETVINMENVDYSYVFDLSSEGASFFLIRDDYGDLQYLGVDIFGEMGRISHSYTFTKQFIIYKVVEIMYSQPFFVDPLNIPIEAVYINRYVVMNGEVYVFIDEDEYVPVQPEVRSRVIDTLAHFLEIAVGQNP